MTVYHLYLCLTIFIYTIEGTLAVIIAAHGNVATTYRRNLSTAEEAVPDHAVPHRDLRGVNTTVIHITTTEDVA